MQKGNFLFEISFLFFYYIYLSFLFLSYLHKQQNISCILLTHPYTDISITSRIFPFLPNDFYIISTHLHYFHFFSFVFCWFLCFLTAFFFWFSRKIDSLEYRLHWMINIFSLRSWHFGIWFLFLVLLIRIK